MDLYEQRAFEMEFEQRERFKAKTANITDEYERYVAGCIHALRKRSRTYRPPISRKRQG